MKSKKEIILPAEWAEQQFVQLTWPHSKTDWANMLEEVNKCFVNIAREILNKANLLIVCVDADEVESFFSEDELLKITFAEMPTNDTWARDHGGITVFENGKPVVYDFAFNGWGMKFPSNYDNLITRNLYMAGVLGDSGHRNCFDFILEGGSIESDGKGIIMTTAECLLSDNRNNLSEDDMEEKLKDYFGAKQVLWLNSGFLVGDDTDSHIDTLARLCPNNTIAYVQCNDETDEHYDELKDMEDELKSFIAYDTKSPFRLIPLPMADAVYENEERLPANFLIVNGVVLMPTYNLPKDNLAKAQLQKAFPEHEIIGIDCNALIKQNGSLHCVTMQYPTAPSNMSEFNLGMKQEETNQIKVALVQQSNTEDREQNILKLEKNIRICAEKGADLIVLQELHNGLYFCQTEDLAVFEQAETIPGPSTEYFGRLAKELKVVLVLSLFEKRAPGLYHNTAVVIENDGSIAGKYRKMHIPEDPAYYEKFYFTPGDLGFEPIQTSLGKLGVLICWDQWYPEAARLMALAGAELLIYPTAIGWESTDLEAEKKRQKNAWITVQRGHAVANGLYIISCNRVGVEADPSGATAGIQFWGNSFVAGPQGEIITRASHVNEENVLVDVDMKRSEAVRRIWPFFRDRRIDMFGDLTKRWRED